MTEPPAAYPPAGPPRGHRRRRIAFLLALLLLAFFLLLWSVRKPVAGRFIDRELAARGVPATYGIADLGLGRQRLTNVVIGDPAHPDLVADWLETETGVGFHGPFLNGVRAGHVRLRARLVDGRVSLGAIDRLLPAPSGKPFALPALDADVADLRVRLETPAGVVGAKITGHGRLDDGFRGKLAAVGTTLSAGGCTIDSPAALLDIRIDRARPHLVGPVRAAGAGCGADRVAAPVVNVDAELGTALDRWSGAADLRARSVAMESVRASAVAGTIRFAGTADATGGTIDMRIADLRGQPGVARSARVTGSYRAGSALGFDGAVRAEHAALSAAMRRTIGTAAAGTAGTPIAPIADAVTKALSRAAADASGQADISVRYVAGQGAARLSRLSLASASGARVALAGGNGIAFGWPTGGMRIDTDLVTAGGGLPEARVRLAQTAAHAPIRGTATVQPYAAGDARLALTPARFSTGGGGETRIATTATLSGPLGDGRVEGLTMPITALLASGRITVNPACAPLSFDRLATSGLQLGAARVTLCPIDGALVRWDGRLGGGAKAGPLALAGTLGTTPLTLAASSAEFRSATGRFALAGVATRIGAPDRVTRLDIGTLAGGLSTGAASGDFADAAGQIGNVPLLLSDAAGTWRFADGKLVLNGALAVADAQADSPRFQPLAGRDVALTLADGIIRATGVLAEPTVGPRVADVSIIHRLSDGTGRADITVPGLVFTEGFQPDLLTKLTFGVIADVRGTVTGEGHIAWAPDGVTSNGVFRTAGTDLAAAFGPVTGIATEIRFTDLLALESAPGQVATIKTINPGVPVTDGTITYRTLANSRIQVESGRWPFAGGALTLDPTLLDFSQPAERRMTFHVAGVKADQFLQQFDFSNLSATGTFDGVLPMIFDAVGGRIEGGDLTVREGGGTIAYVGDLSQKDLGFWGNLAFQALKSLKYRKLTIGMNGPLAGEMITSVRFAGVNQGEGAKSNFLIRRLQRLPFVFNITIQAPFRGLLDSTQSFYDPKRLLQREALVAPPPEPVAPAAPSPVPVQTPDSRIVP